MIGSVDDIGTDTGAISSTGNQGISSCPYNVQDDAWIYWNNGWIIADANEVRISCLTGTLTKMSLWITMFYHSKEVCFSKLKNAKGLRWECLYS